MLRQAQHDHNIVHNIVLKFGLNFHNPHLQKTDLKFVILLDTISLFAEMNYEGARSNSIWFRRLIMANILKPLHKILLQIKQGCSLFLLALLLLPISSLSYASEPAALHSSTQLVVVRTADWNAVDGTLQRYERKAAGKKWQAVGKPVTVVVGKAGLAWGIGVLSADELGAVTNDPNKKEGDAKSPAGIFYLSRAFGYASNEQPGWKMPYISLTPYIECVDDSNSKFYNQIVDSATVSADWNSSEHMLRSDDLYRWGVVVDHNTNPPQPGRGSCIFLHIWRGPGQGTMGCTAMPIEDLESLLAWLDPARKPLLVQMPKAQYEQLKWKEKLPSLTF
jgi:D-alanyl-D-alanine dipeptidase